ncbi:hypothetical protein BpHYR1_035548 [Brachionus plicatilis]|uniref:Uncharacterized protein n=1 Tax=Brachionus plicatilis TaxID=10195 RepID=A0A3M7PFX2_BRAPC|nr:hypothetical protein BpHYR1_035548 [Brachionus plicatilis]
MTILENSRNFYMIIWFILSFLNWFYIKTVHELSHAKTISTPHHLEAVLSKHLSKFNEISDHFLKKNILGFSNVNVSNKTIISTKICSKIQGILDLRIYLLKIWDELIFNLTRKDFMMKTFVYLNH